jgi:hypothetical protein
VMKVEYIWMDGTQPTKRLRSKTKILEKASWLDRKAEFPKWGFDGSSAGSPDFTRRAPTRSFTRASDTEGRRSGFRSESRKTVAATSKTVGRVQTWIPTW